MSACAGRLRRKDPPSSEDVFLPRLAVLVHNQYNAQRPRDDLFHTVRGLVGRPPIEHRLASRAVEKIMIRDSGRLRRGATRLEVGLLASTLGLLLLMAVDVLTQSVENEAQIMATSPTSAASLSVIEYSMNHARQDAPQATSHGEEAEAPPIAR